MDSKLKYTKSTIVGAVSYKSQKIAPFDRRRIARYKRNMFYLSGNQHLGYNVKYNFYYVSQFSADPQAKKPVINKLINAYLVNVSKFTKNLPGFYVPPSTSDKPDEDAAEVAYDVMNYLHKYLDEKGKSHEHWGWKLALGSVIHKRYWENETDNIDEDYETKPLYHSVKNNVDGKVWIECGAEYTEDEVPLDGCPECGSNNLENSTFIRETEEESGETEQIPLGNMVYEVIPPMDIVMPLTASSIETTPWIKHRRLQYIDDIRDRWGKKADKIQGGSGGDIDYDLTASQLNRIMAEGFGYGGIPILVTSDKDYNQDMSVYEEYYQRPSKMYPKGFYAVMANDVLLDMKEEIPHKIEEMFRMHHFIKFPGHIWGFGVVDLGVTHQDRINRLQERKQLNDDFNIFPKIWAPRDSNITGHDGNIDTVAEFDHNQGDPVPYTMPGKGLPDDVTRDQYKAEDDLDEATFNVGVRSGQVPKGAESGVAFKFLSEKADDSLFDISGRYEANMEKEWRFTLDEFAKHTPEERALKIIGKNKRIKFRQFKGADIENCTDVRIKEGSSYPQSIAGKQELMLELASRGFLGDFTSDPRKMDTFLNFFGVKDNFLDENNVDVEQAKHENYLILEKKDYVWDFQNGKVEFPINIGKNVRFNPETGQPEPQYKTLAIFENFQIHYLIHSDEMKKPSYDEFDNDTKAFMQFHLNETMMAMQEQMMNQMKMQAQQEGQQKQQKSQSQQAR